MKSKTPAAIRESASERAYRYGQPHRKRANRIRLVFKIQIAPGTDVHALAEAVRQRVTHVNA